MKNRKFVLVTKENYQEFYNYTQKLDIGPMLLPKHWINKLWGVVVYDADKLIAGWVGTKRINSKWIQCLYQEIVFNSHPQIFDNELDNEIFSQEIIEATISLSKNAKIASLVISAWSRTYYQYVNLRSFIRKNNATFILKLKEHEDLLVLFEYNQRKQIKKAIRNELDFVIYDNINNNTILSVFAELRAKTQQRAIKQNKKSSMLLKSVEYHKYISDHYDSKLVAVYYNEKLAAMIQFLKSGLHIYPYYAGSDLELIRATGASSFLYYKLMLYAKEQGCEYFDMGGSPINSDKDHPAYGIYSFKKSFGGEYKEFTCGDIIVSKWKYKLIKLIKENRIITRMLSKIM